MTTLTLEEQKQELLDLQLSLAAESISSEEYLQGVNYILFGTPVPPAK